MAKAKKVAKRSGKIPQSKSELIRKLSAKGKTTAQIIDAVEKTGQTVYYSEISRARATA